MHKHKKTSCNYIIKVKIVNMYDDMNIMMHSVATQEVTYYFSNKSTNQMQQFLKFIT